MHVASDRRWDFAAAPDEVWARLADTSAYPRWWPWLRRFDADRLASGDVWYCTVKPPLPYSLSFVVALEQVEPPTTIAAGLSGDLRGTARIEIAATAEGSRLRLLSDLEPAPRPVAMLATLARPLARWGHDWVLETGARQFAERALS